MRWDERREVKKGAFGEDIIDRLISRRGRSVPYCPAIDGPHPFDRLVASRLSGRVTILDVKTKRRRKNWPDTGIDVRHYQEYRRRQEANGVPVYLVFVDDGEARIYGNYLDVLDQPRKVDGVAFEYPSEYGGIRYWPLEAMDHWCDLTDVDMQRLATLSAQP